MVWGHAGGEEEQAGITIKSFLQLRITKETRCLEEKGGKLRGQGRCVCVHMCVYMCVYVRVKKGRSMGDAQMDESR